MNDDKIVSNAVAQLASVFENENNAEVPVTNLIEALWAACQRVGQAAGITVVKPTSNPLQATIRNLLLQIANISQFRIRKVLLSGAWWEKDNGPLLVFDKVNFTPMALIPSKGREYHLIDPVTGKKQLLTPALANTLAPEAFCFYRTFPNTVLTVRSLLNFALRGQKQDILYLLFMQCCIGLVGLFVPIATGYILDTAVPEANLSILWQFIFGLSAAAFASFAFNFMLTLTMIRLRFKINQATQAAVWDRLLRLPVSFFRNYNPGDLTMRASGVDAIQQEITDTTLQTLLGGIFSILTLILMFYYSPLLALFSIGMLIILVVITVVSSIIQLRFQRPILYLQGKLAALTFQFFTSISKLRVSNSESRAFALWADQFAQKTRLFFQASVWEIRFTIVQTLFSTFILLILYLLVGKKIAHINFGNFISFNAAFGQFFAATMALAGSLIASINLIPLYERIKPILTTLPELEKEGIEPEELTGRIEIKQVSFRYLPETPLVLEDTNIQINPGEFIAFAGATGSGKSTIIRLLLGFEAPTSGAISYDGENLVKLNIRAVREQLGVVLQNSTLVAGTIFENIVGSRPLAIEDAWEAAKQAGLAADIEAMPMGMHTLVTEGGKTLSMGQRQRLMIARALVSSPRILFLDEATSALDNPTQAEIMSHLEKLNITRVMVAHRLSTVVNATRIYVLENGHIVQHGTYKELITQAGPFADLVKRQLI